MANPCMSTNEVAGYFSHDYDGACDKFKAACTKLGVDIATFVHPLQGPNQQVLSTGVALLGRRDATKLLIVVSGTHGPEGLAGSGCQVGWLRNGGPISIPDDVAVLLVHFINPWGAAWGRRQTEDNVDLNRNFLDFTTALPGNDLYVELMPGLHCPDHDTVKSNVKNFIAKHGMAGLAQALFQGQYVDVEGIGFGGMRPTWSNETLHAILRTYSKSVRLVSVIDLHTGYGPFGHGMLLNADEPDSKELKLAHKWYGDGLIALKAGGGLPYDVAGDLGTGMRAALPHATVVPVAIEYGTYAVDQLLWLQVDDCWLHHYGEFNSSQGRDIRANLRKFFYPATLDWQQLVYFRAHQVIEQTLSGLAATECNLIPS